jgi:mannose-6-phosphate isomerase-like protein (cupin superfamily)
MKLVIAGVNEHGRSYIESSQNLTDTRVIHVWHGGLGDDARRIADIEHDPHIAPMSPPLEPPPGGMHWIYNRVPTLADAESVGYQNTGMHATRTVDFNMVIEGRLNCELDDDVAELEAGDFIILRSANHKWVNPGDTWATMLIMLHQPIIPPA